MGEIQKKGWMRNLRGWTGESQRKETGWEKGQEGSRVGESERGENI